MHGGPDVSDYQQAICGCVNRLFGREDPLAGRKTIFTKREKKRNEEKILSVRRSWSVPGFEKGELAVKVSEAKGR